jgi:hypothetical protein
LQGDLRFIDTLHPKGAFEQVDDVRPWSSDLFWGTWAALGYGALQGALTRRVVLQVSSGVVLKKIGPKGGIRILDLSGLTKQALGHYTIN